MEITHLGKFYAPHKGGMETALRNLAEVGTELGHSVECVVSAVEQDFAEPDDFDDKVKSKVGNQVRLVRYSVHRQFLSAPLPWQMLRHRFEKTDLLHVHIPNPIAELTVLARIFVRSSRVPKLRLIPFLHAIPTRHKVLAAIWWRLVTLPILRRSEMILVSNNRLAFLFPQLESVRKKIRVLPFFAPPLSDAAISAVQGKRQNSKRVLALGRLVSYKGYDVLIRAWREALDRRNPENSSYRLDIVGEGPQAAPLKRLISELRLENEIHLLGGCSEEEKAQYFSDAAVFIAPSVSNAETFGFSILEAMAYALPVITTDLQTGVQILSRNGECGAVARAANKEDLADAILKLCGMTSTERCEIGANNLRFQRTHYTREKCLAQYADYLISPEA